MSYFLQRRRFAGKQRRARRCRAATDRL